MAQLSVQQEVAVVEAAQGAAQQPEEEVAGAAVAQLSAQQGAAEAVEVQPSAVLAEQEEGPSVQRPAAAPSAVASACRPDQALAPVRPEPG